MSGLLALAAIVAVAPLAIVLAFVVLEGLPGLDLQLVTGSPVPPGASGGGVAPAIVGSLLMVGLGTAMGAPVAILAAIYVREYAGARRATAVRFLIDVLAGLPTIAIGLFVYGLLVVPMGSFSALAGAAALAIIVLPIVARVTDEMLGLVPNSIREAALALGVAPWRIVILVVLPAARVGIATGLVLGLARIAGETAPLIFTALGNQRLSLSLGAPIDALPLRIWTYASGPYAAWHTQAWAASLLLIVLVLGVSLLTRAIVGRLTLRGRS